MNDSEEELSYRLTGKRLTDDKMLRTWNSGQPELLEELSPQNAEPPQTESLDEQKPETEEVVDNKILQSDDIKVETESEQKKVADILDELLPKKEDVNCDLPPKAESQIVKLRGEPESLDIHDAKDDLISSETPKSESSAELRKCGRWRRHRRRRNNSRKSIEPPKGENAVEEPQDKDNVGTEKITEADSASEQVQELVKLNIDGTGPVLEKFFVKRNPSPEAIATVAHPGQHADLNIYGAKPILDQIFVEEEGQSALEDAFEMHQDVVVPLVIGNGALPKKRAARRDKTRKHKGVGTPQLEKQDFVDVLGKGELLKKILQPGTRRSPRIGDRVVVNVQREIPEIQRVLRDERIEFVLGDGDVVQALELVVPLMKLKETCQVMAGHKYMYGELGLEPAVPPCSTFKLTVKLQASKGPFNYIAMDMRTRFEEVKKKRDRGNFLVKRGEYLLALNSYSKANWILEQAPTIHKSREVMEQCLELIAMINTCVTLYKLEEYALMFDEKTIRSSYGKPYIRVGQALETAGDIEGAIDSYKQALKHDEDKNKNLIYNHIERLTRLCEKERTCEKEDSKTIATI